MANKEIESILFIKRFTTYVTVFDKYSLFQPSKNIKSREVQPTIGTNWIG